MSLPSHRPLTNYAHRRGAMAANHNASDLVENQYSLELIKHEQLWWVRWGLYAYTAFMLAYTPFIIAIPFTADYAFFAVMWKLWAFFMSIVCVGMSVSMHWHVEFTPMRKWIELKLEEEQPKQTITPWPTRYRPRKQYPRIQCVYLIRDLDVTGFTKIGRTNDLHSRLSTFGAKLPFKFQIVHIIETNDSRTLEHNLHKHFAKQRVNNSEWFALSPADVAWIRQIRSA